MLFLLDILLLVLASGSLGYFSGRRDGAVQDLKEMQAVAAGLADFERENPPQVTIRGRDRRK